jgi:mono/diheme cytochrome c family protein
MLRLTLRFAIAVMLASTSLVLFASSSGTVFREGDSIESLIANIPQKARSKTNPVEKNPDAPLAGKKLFEQHCAECHGENASGTKRGPSLNLPQLQQATSGELFWIITNGVVRRGMPSWSKLPEPQRWQIVTFLRGSKNSVLMEGRPHLRR